MPMRLHLHHPITQTGLALIAVVVAMLLPAAVAGSADQRLDIWVLIIMAVCNPLIGFYAKDWWRYTLSSAAGFAALCLAAAVLADLGSTGPTTWRSVFAALDLPAIVYAGALGVTGAARFAIALIRHGHHGPLPLEHIVPEPILYASIGAIGLVIGSAAFFGGYGIMDAIKDRTALAPAQEVEQAALLQLLGKGEVVDRRLGLSAVNATDYALTELTIRVAPADGRAVPEPALITRDLQASPWLPGRRLRDRVVLDEPWDGLDVVWSVVAARGASPLAEADQPALEVGPAAPTEEAP
ncbi:MAG: hypothetical protein HXY25_06850 [Alphaproteobacteria bacterium]|nr:hypothetical protein [Alphaproteobacteria bacterium]